MKKLISIALILVVILTTLSGCGGKSEKTSDVSENSTAKTVQEEKTDGKDNSDEKYDFIDNRNKLMMRMDNNKYHCYESGNNKIFLNEDICISYSPLSGDSDGEIKDVQLFIKRFILILDSAYDFMKMQNDLKETGKKTINGFDVRCFEGTLTDDYGQLHTTKAYTFICGKSDCVVVATTCEENTENAEQVKGEIDVFMNNLAVLNAK